jgi:hypothetical protein
VSENHPAVVARNHLLDIAGIWPELEARVARGGNPDPRDSGDQGKRKRRSVAPIPIDPAVVDVMAEVEAWVVFLAHILMDEVIIETPVLGPVRATLSVSWAPVGVSTPGLLRQVAERVGHFTEHEDEMLRLAFMDEVRDFAHKAQNAARPPSRRWIRLGVPCLEHGTSDLGERIVCTGQYGTLLGEGLLGDMICEKDSMHRMTPLEWQRGQRRGAFDDQAMQELVRRVLRVGGAG